MSSLKEKIDDHFKNQWPRNSAEAENRIREIGGGISLLKNYRRFSKSLLRRRLKEERSGSRMDEIKQSRA